MSADNGFIPRAFKSLGETGGSIIETVKAAREAFGDEPGELEPMFRAVFVDYLRRHA